MKETDEERRERRSRGEKALGWSPAQGWGPGLGVGSMPGAPGINDSAIFAEQRRRDRLNQQQFDPDGLPKD